MAEEPSLSFRAARLVSALEREVGGQAPAAAWLRALVQADQAAAEAVLGTRGLDAVRAAAQVGAAGESALTRTDVISIVLQRAAGEQRPLVSAADVAAALAEAARLGQAGQEPAAPPQTAAAPEPAAPTEPAVPPEPAALSEPATTPEPSLAAPEPLPAPAQAPPAFAAPETPLEAAPTSVAGTGAPAGRARTFRLFVSSTFADFAAERDALRQRVWPRLRQYCASRNARFQEVDLRWGVSEEAAVDQQTMIICLEELRRCHDLTPRPNFLVLMGNRHGWLPPPPAIPAAEWDLIMPVLDEDGQALLAQWYERDDNAVPAEYRLCPRTGHFTDAAIWAKTEAGLHRLLADAVAGSPIPDRRRRAYLASATEQEILAGAIEAERADQVVCFCRDITGYPDVTASGPDDPVRQFADADQRPVQALLQRLRERLGQGLLHEAVPWDGNGPALSEAYLDRFTGAVCEALQAAIAEELSNPLPAPAQPGASDPDLDEEGRAHREFASQRRRFFTGRAGELRQIASYLGSGSARPLVLYGGGGTGKSALMAGALEEAIRRPGAGLLAARFAGATPASSDVRALLGSICRELARRSGQPETGVPGDYTDLVADFQNRLAQATPGQPVTVLVDSLDQLSASGPGHSLAWIPVQLPPHARVVVSTRPGSALSALQGRADLLEVPGLPAADGAELLDRWLDDAGRTLQPAQRAHVLDGFARSGGNPLYLKLAFEEARRWRSASAEPTAPLEADVAGLIRGNLFGRLEREDQHGRVLVSRALGYLAASRYGLAEDELLDLLSRDADVYGWFLDGAFHIPPDLTEVAVSYRSRHQPAVAAGDGVPQPDTARTAAEWLRMLRDDPARRGELRGFLSTALPVRGGPRLPIVLWSRLFSDLQPYLTERRTEGGDLLAFHHRELADAARDVYLPDDDAGTLHSRLADYFEARADPAGDRSWGAGPEQADLRGLSELPHHLIRAGRWEDACATLTDFGFLEQKAVKVGVLSQQAGSERENLYTGVFQLQDDFDEALRRLPGATSTAGPPRLIVTATDFGDGLVIRCPHCAAVHCYRPEWLDQAIACPGCGAPLKVNPFVVARDRA